MNERCRRGRTSWRTVAIVAMVLLVAQLRPASFGRQLEFGRVGPDKWLHLVGPAGFAAVLADALTSE